MARKNITTTSTTFPNEFFATEEEFRSFMSAPVKPLARTLEEEYGPEVKTVRRRGESNATRWAREDAEAAKVEAEKRGYGDTDFCRAVVAQYGDKAKAIRALGEQGMKPSLIAKQMGIRPQHVHNTLNQVYKGAR